MIKTSINLTKSDKMVAFANVAVNDQYTIRGIKLWSNKEGVTVEMPSQEYKDKQGYKRKSYLFSFNSKDHQIALEGEIIEAYHVAVKEQTSKTVKA